MARATFGGTTADTVARRVKVLGHDVDDYEAATLTVWSAQTGGTQYTDLLVNGAASNSVPVDSTGQVPEFQGPDGITSVWVTAGGDRVKMLPAEGPTDTSVAGYVNDSASSTRAALDKTYRSAFLVTAYGAKGDGTTDDTSAIQAAINAAPSGGAVHLPSGNYKITSPISVTKPLRISGGRRGTQITSYACNGFNIASGLTEVTIENLKLVSSVLYTTTTNTLIGVNVQGASGSSPGFDTFRDLQINGYQTAIQANYLGQSLFDGIYTSGGLIGIDVYGLSINNTVKNCQILVGNGTGTRLAGSKAIALNGQVASGNTTAVQSEGWVITGSVLFGGDYLVDLIGVACCIVSNNILDYAHVAAVRTINNTTAYSSDHVISGNYIAMASDASTTGGAIEIANGTGGSSVRGVRIIGNDLLSYGTAAPYGVHTIGNQSSLVTVSGNTFNGFQTYDVYLQSSNNIVTGNFTFNAGIYNFYSAAGALNLIANNTGNVWLDSSAGYPNVYVQNANNKLMYAAAAPTAGGWARGDRVQQSAPAVGSPKGWVCTVAGSPGTWVSEGNL